jgi:3-methyladenine DNA glycosylase AlkD
MVAVMARTRVSGADGRERESVEDVLGELRGLADAKNVEGMRRFGISAENTLGISVTTLRSIAKRIGRDHALAQELWASGVHEARQLACLIEEPGNVTKRQLASWVRDIDSWDVCDGFAWGLVDATPYAAEMALRWSGAKGEFVKRAGFAVMAGMAVHDKQAPDETLLQFLPVIRREAGDGRNYVKKAVNWALRQIGDRDGGGDPRGRHACGPVGGGGRAAGVAVGGGDGEGERRTPEAGAWRPDGGMREEGRRRKAARRGTG